MTNFPRWPRGPGHPRRRSDAADLGGCQRRPVSVSRGMEQLMLGAHRWPLLTGMELTAYRDWLTQRRQLAQPGSFSTRRIVSSLARALMPMRLSLSPKLAAELTA